MAKKGRANMLARAVIKGLSQLLFFTPCIITWAVEPESQAILDDWSQSQKI